jgi:Ni/Co efflux regulator RcnB
MKTLIKTTALALAASGMAATALPAAAHDFQHAGYNAAPQHDNWNRHRNRDRHRGNDRYGASYGYDDSRYAYGEPVYRDTRVWRGDDGRTYCRKRDGTTGLIIGGAAGALLGRELDGGRDRTLGTILGAAAGALLGREVDGHGTRCR